MKWQPYYTDISSFGRQLVLEDGTQYVAWVDCGKWHLAKRKPSGTWAFLAAQKTWSELNEFVKNDIKEVA